MNINRDKNRLSSGEDLEPDERSSHTITETERDEFIEKYTGKKESSDDNDSQKQRIEGVVKKESNQIDEATATSSYPQQNKE